MSQRQIKRRISHLPGIIRVSKTHFLGKSIGIQPVDQLLAPAGDNRGLGIVHMRIHEPRADQRVAVIGHGGIRMCHSQTRAAPDGDDLAAFDDNAASPVVMRCTLPVSKGLAVKPQGLS